MTLLALVLGACAGDDVPRVSSATESSARSTTTTPSTATTITPSSVTSTTVGSNAPAAVPTTSGELEVYTRVTEVCTHDMVPPDPRCAPQPVSGVEVIVDEDGVEVARGITGDDGLVTFTLAPRIYDVVGQPKDGFRITPPPMQSSVVAGETTHVELTYNTGNQ